MPLKPRRMKLMFWDKDPFRFLIVMPPRGLLLYKFSCATMATATEQCKYIYIYIIDGSSREVLHAPTLYMSKEGGRESETGWWRERNEQQNDWSSDCCVRTAVIWRLDFPLSYLYYLYYICAHIHLEMEAAYKKHESNFFFSKKKGLSSHYTVQYKAYAKAIWHAEDIYRRNVIVSRSTNSWYIQ